MKVDLKNVTFMYSLPSVEVWDIAATLTLLVPQAYNTMDKCFFSNNMQSGIIQLWEF